MTSTLTIKKSNHLPLTAVSATTTDFEGDCLEIVGYLQPELTSGEQWGRTLEIVRTAVLHQHKKYKSDALLGSAHRAWSYKGGKAGAQSRRHKAKDWQSECAIRAHALLAQGRSQRELTGILSKHFGRSRRHILDVLKKAEVK